MISTWKVIETVMAADPAISIAKRRTVMDVLRGEDVVRITAPEAARLLHVSTRTFHRLARRHKWRKQAITRKMVFYNRSEILDYAHNWNRVLPPGRTVK